MDDHLLLPVSFNDAVLEFPFRVVQGGYVRRFVVYVDAVEVQFEADDSGELRAIIPHINEIAGPLPGKALLEAIGASIARLISPA